MLTLEKITLGYEGRTLLQEASATLKGGELTALVGRNGTGKSTLLRAIAGLGVCSQGEIRIQGEPLRQLSAQQRAEQIALVTTERIRIANLRCRDVVALGRAPYTNWIGQMQEEDRLLVDQALERVGMSSYAERALDTLSDGECQRIMIARALAQQTPILLLDEPTSFLDMPARYELGSLLRELAHQEEKCILFSTHELDIALRCCDSIALIEEQSLHHLPTPQMVQSGHIERLFSHSRVDFDAISGQIKSRD